MLFAGINPGLYSGATGHHFARPGNRFWRTLHEAGFTPHILTAWEDATLPSYGVGITNLVGRATASAAELSDDELRAGGVRLAASVRGLRPRAVAILGISAYRSAFSRPKATLGRQPDDLEGVPLWVLPNPSGLNASYQMPDLVRVYGELRMALRGGLGTPPQ